MLDVWGVCEREREMTDAWALRRAARERGGDEDAGAWRADHPGLIACDFVTGLIDSRGEYLWSVQRDDGRLMVAHVKERSENQVRGAAWADCGCEI